MLISRNIILRGCSSLWKASQQLETISQNQSSTTSTVSSSSTQQTAGQDVSVDQTTQGTPQTGNNSIVQNSLVLENHEQETNSSTSIFSLPNIEEGWLYTLPPNINSSQSISFNANSRQTYSSNNPPSPHFSSQPPPSPVNDTSTEQDYLLLENQRFDEAAKSFYQLWAPCFSACESLADLSSVLDRCCVDWLSRTKNLDPR